MKVSSSEGVALSGSSSVSTSDGKNAEVRTKPFDISKREVWDAYKRVKANRGAAGVDGQSIDLFDENLKENLYKLLAWRLSNTLTTDFCIDAVEEAIASYGPPEIFNTDQGCQFTDVDFTTMLKGHGITISMDGKGAWRDNVFVERFWRSIKYEEVYLRAYESASEAKHYIGRYIDFYNGHRPHSSHGGQTPNAAYAATQALPGSLPQPRRTGDVKAA